MSKSRQKLGKWGESQAADYLEIQGYRILAKNVHTSYGEIDIVAHKDDITVFVEVKTRRTKSYGYPEESITKLKRQHMIDAGLDYLVEHPELGNTWRIDVISLYKPKNSAAEITHFENAIWE